MLNDVRTAGFVTPFFESLGQYVYGYKDTEGNWEYIGKGNHARALSHIKSKELDPSNLYIIARNLEKFSHKKDQESFILESFLITSNQPKLNSVSGHYQECFVMAKFSELFGSFVSTQRDNFESFPEWYIENYEMFRNRMRLIQINSTATYFEGNTINSMQMSWYWEPGNETVKQVNFSIWQTGEKGDALCAKVFTFLEANGYTDDQISGPTTRKNGMIYTVDVPDIHNVIKLFDDFMS